MQKLSTHSTGSRARLQAFTLVEIMVVVVIIGLLAALGLPAFRQITMRSKATAAVNDFRAFSAAFVTYNIQNGRWPAATNTQEIPPEMATALTNQFRLKTPIGGGYKWNSDVAAGGIPDIKAAISIEPATDNPMNLDLELLERIDAQMDDGNLLTGNIRQGAYYSLVYIIEL